MSGHHLSDECFAHAGEYVMRCIAGETILVPVSAGVADLEAIYVLNATAALVWNRIDGRTPASAFIDAVTSEFDVSLAEATADVAGLLHSLLDDGLIALRPSPRLRPVGS